MSLLILCFIIGSKHWHPKSYEIHPLWFRHILIILVGLLLMSYTKDFKYLEGGIQIPWEGLKNLDRKWITKHALNIRIDIQPLACCYQQSSVFGTPDTTTNANKKLAYAFQLIFCTTCILCPRYCRQHSLLGRRMT